MIFARKINKIPGFYMAIAQKCISLFFLFLFGGGTCPHCPPSLPYSTPMARVFAISIFDVESCDRTVGGGGVFGVESHRVALCIIAL